MAFADDKNKFTSLDALLNGQGGSADDMGGLPAGGLDSLLGGEVDFDTAMQDALKSLDLPSTQDDASSDDGSPMIVCPHCWHKFCQSRIYAISRHPSLTGDSVLGDDAQLRFLPTRFTPDGTAMDARGMACPDLACPHCHLQIPESMLSLPCSQISIVGSPSSGKSYFLTAMLHSLKNILMRFNYSLAEADASMDMVLSRYERLLFNNSSTETYVSLPKTELQGNDFSSQVHLDGVDLQLPLPFVYILKPLMEGIGSNLPAQNLVLYDNAGEHFEPGRDTATNPATQHLVNSECIMFLFDPFKDTRSMGECSKEDPQAGVFRQTADQVQILNEMIARIRKSSPRSMTGKHKAPLVLVIPKFDAWRAGFPIDLGPEDFANIDADTGFHALDITNVKMVSYAARQWILRHVPELPAVAEAFFEYVYYIPVSALGRGPEFDSTHNILGIRPDNLKPLWCEVPLLIYLWHTGHIGGVFQAMPGTQPADAHCTFRKGTLFFQPPGARFPVPIPDMFQDADVYDDKMGLIHFPRCPEAQADERRQEKGDEADFWNS